MNSIGRRAVLAGGAALVAACGGGGAKSSKETPDDMVLGNANANVTLIEYASCTCPVCAQWHKDVWAQLKANYIDAGKIRFVFREFPTHVPPVSLAGFQVARCGGATAEQYFERLDKLYEEQESILASGTSTGARDRLVALGAQWGLSASDVNACILDEAGPARIRRLDATAKPFDVTGTPTLILNGRKLEDAAAFTYEGLARLLDAAAAG